MSWVADIRCLHCDGKLPLYRKITKGQFCNAAHRKAYWQEHERLTVERLMQTHDSLHANRPPVAVQAILGQPEAEAPGLRQLIQPRLLLTAVRPPEIVAADSLAHEINAKTAFGAQLPAWTPQISFGRQIPMADFVVIGRPALRRWLADQIATTEPQAVEPAALPFCPGVSRTGAGEIAFASPVEMSMVERTPVARSPLCDVSPVDTAALPFCPEVSRTGAGEIAFASPVEMSVVERNPVARSPLCDVSPLDTAALPFCPVVSRTGAGEIAFASPVEMSVVTRTSGANSLLRDDVTPIDTTLQNAVYPLLLAAPAQSKELQRQPDPRIPQPAGPLGFPRFLVRANTQAEPVRQPGAILAQLPLVTLRLRTNPVSATLLYARLRQLSLDQAPLAQEARLFQGARLFPGATLDSLGALEAPKFVMATRAISPRLRLAPGRRYGVERPEAPVAMAGYQQDSVFATAPPAVSLPERKAMAAAADSVPVPSRGGMLPLACSAHPSQPGGDAVAVSEASSIPQPPRAEPMRPVSKLEPIDVKPISDVLQTPVPSLANVLPEPPEHTAGRQHIWTHAIDFWNSAPRNTKMLVIAIPVLLGLAFSPSLPTVRAAAPATAAGIRWNFQRVRQSVLDRAAVALDEDFRAGLDDWASRDDASTEWSFDATGFVRPGPLALYRPSVGLTDYQMQFLGLIDKKALSWVVRASDFDNYYVVKMVVLKPGPLPTIGVTRYAVVNGKAGARSDTVAPIDARADMLYRVRVDVAGDTFLLTVQGQMVDSWSEPRLKHGGVGFFSARGEESRLRWVQVTHQYDMLGRLCAYLAPYKISSMNGSWQ